MIFFASTVTRGKHVPPLLNALNVEIAVVGNHDLDFGVETFVKLSGLCKFPWLCSNLKIAGTTEYAVIEKGGIRVGFFGVVGSDFVGCLNFDTKGLVAEDQMDCTKVCLFVCFSNLFFLVYCREWFLSLMTNAM
jgi:2',3'-cyclic-nucleotide 2'-phosphodiesterase (5'-nucleotidase family)